MADLGAWVCFDEAGQGLRPPTGRTWGRRGQTPVVRVTAAGTKRVSLAAMICTRTGHRPRLIYRTLVDRGPRHGRRKGFTEAGYARLLTVFQLPPYAPALNPVEAVGFHLKRSLANLAKRNIDQLTALIKTRLKRMQYRSGLEDL